MKTCSNTVKEVKNRLGKVDLFRSKLIPIFYNKSDKYKYGYLFY